MTAPPGDALAALMVTHGDRLLAYVHRHAGAPLLRFETADDLVQGIHHEALRSAARFDPTRTEEEQLGWVFQVARRHLSGRRDHWFAMKRYRGGLLRLTVGGSASDGLPPLDPSASATGPGTFADRRDQLLVLTRAMDLLLPRDQDLLRWSSEGLSVQEQADRLGVTADTAKHARARALERLQRAYRFVLAKKREGDSG